MVAVIKVDASVDNGQSLIEKLMCKCKVTNLVVGVVVVNVSFSVVVVVADNKVDDNVDNSQSLIANLMFKC